jgi:hypothetical protein
MLVKRYENTAIGLTFEEGRVTKYLLVIHHTVIVLSKYDYLQ